MEKWHPASGKPEDIEAAALADAIFNQFIREGVLKGSNPEKATNND